MIKIEQLHKKFGKNQVLKGVDLEFLDKGIFAIIGPNGSGKTTLIKALLGMVVPDKGDLSVGGTSIRKDWRYRDQIDYLPQIANFPANLTVKELISMIKDLRNRPGEDKRLIALFKLEPFLSKKLSNLSGGTKQKVNLVLTLMFDSPIIILDEPTTGLDPIALIHLKELIKEEKAKGKIILITSHIMSFVEEMADEIVFLLEGKVYFKGNIEALKTQTDESNFEHAIANLLTQEDV
ncbi:MAG: ABC transporter ATP-binding protein [Flavobacteriaceae bacterium]|jgi:Cu-processing system ATP-binding protein|nr:ABC transporter ATP-binding protein [Flavobacteriaceae bacterium]MBT3939010.1 ABC transporter ATP-binding protein [Pelagibacterales bacterium]MBT4952159.1 ABC transporter ATP-binding protein [Pelagibacteraceae bacterium]MBT4415359.1 ABC transporter ATP-binding protein [Flavobacteriaceae bacterium]MBT5396560.1 ABC transporter ATP-binding protein [Flavobacteriaceae bacterium]